MTPAADGAGGGSLMSDGGLPTGTFGDGLACSALAGAGLTTVGAGAGAAGSGAAALRQRSAGTERSGAGGAALSVSAAGGVAGSGLGADVRADCDWDRRAASWLASRACAPRSKAATALSDRSASRTLKVWLQTPQRAMPPLAATCPSVSRNTVSHQGQRAASVMALCTRRGRPSRLSRARLRAADIACRHESPPQSGAQARR